MGRSTSLTASGKEAISRDIDSKYDVVKAVADNLPATVVVAVDILKGIGTNSADDSAILNALNNAKYAVAQVGIATDEATKATNKAAEASVSANSAFLSATEAGVSANLANSIKNMSVTYTQLPPEGTATVEYTGSNGVMAFSIPKGMKGDNGVNGQTPILSATTNGGILTINIDGYTDSMPSDIVVEEI